MRGRLEGKGKIGGVPSVAIALMTAPTAQMSPAVDHRGVSGGFQQKVPARPVHSMMPVSSMRHAWPKSARTREGYARSHEGRRSAGKRRRMFAGLMSRWMTALHSVKDGFFWDTCLL